MRRIFIILAIVLAGLQIVTAQKTENPSKIDMDEVNLARKEAALEAKMQKGPITSSITEADAGEIDSFNKNAKFMGTAASGSAIIYTSCDPAILLADLGITLGPDDRCLAAPNPAVTSTAVFTDMARITIPARTLSNVLYMINNHTILWDFQNNTMGQIFGQMSYSPRITIESVALNDPAAINPDTGLPMMGSYTTAGSGTKFKTQLLATGAFESNVESYSRANTTGLSRQFFRALGLSDAIINNIYRNPLTVRLGMRLSVRGVQNAQFTYTARCLGQ